MIQYVFGDGKGKTTSAIGSAIRMAGSGGKVLFVQFFKNNDSSEVTILNSIDNIEYLFQDEKYELFEDNNELLNSLFDAYKKLVATVFEKQKLKEYSMIVLDEFQYVFEKSFDEKEREVFVSVIKEISKNAEIIITGHIRNDELVLVADYVSEVKKIKHPYDEGKEARKGVEY